MRNLKLLTTVRVPPLAELKGAQCFSVDCDTGLLYCASAERILGLDPRGNEITSIVSLVEDGYLPADGSGKVVGIQYLADQQSVCVATSAGDLLLWSVLLGQLECVGCVDSGLIEMAWSPDLELLILITGQDTIIMMTREFDPIIETSMHPEQFGESKFITVGWGKKETQFHGSEGKIAAQKKTEEMNLAVSWDDRKSRVSWRGDGQYFVISSVGPDTGVRKLRVWSRECIHQSTSETADGLEQSLAWKPSGSLIATSQSKPNKHEVIFFEKNGLRHLEFALPFAVKAVQVKELLWNIESTVLAVWCRSLPTQDVSSFHLRDYVQLWIVGNYHWYLKQSLHFDASNDGHIVDVVWDPEHAYRLHIMSDCGQYLQYTWSWTTDRSRGKTSSDFASVAVIDGDKVLMTPMCHMVVPPPLSSYQILLSSPVNQVAYAPDPHSNDIALLTTDNRLHVYRFTDDKSSDNSIMLDAAGGNGFVACCKTPILQGAYSIDGMKSIYPLSIHHLTWVTSDLFVFCSLDSDSGSVSVLHQAQLQNSDSKLVVRSSFPLEGLAYSVCSAEKGSVAVQLENGTLLRYDPVSEILLPWEANTGREISFPLPCSEMAVCDIGGEEVILGLTERFRFYVNDMEVASNCTSFVVHNEFLLLTTLSHTCRCICRQTKVQVLPTLSDGKAHPFDESIRRLERGSRIVTVVQDDTKLVLQMPRGNVEAVHPRALVLSTVRKHLDSLQFKQAFVVMRKHRINMNLIHDHNPEAFLANVRMFIEQVESVSHINLFLTDLIEEDVTMVMYTASYNRHVADTGEERPSKVDTVCDAVRRALCGFDEDRYLLSVLTCYVRKSTPELETALLLIKSLRGNNKNVTNVSEDEALKYLLFLVDVNKLYDVALGTYNFDLVLMVAERSQKDPKEYIPFLNNLRKLSIEYQKFTIDRHLKRYKIALRHIAKCGPEHFSECLTLVKEQKLYAEALQLFSVGTSNYQELALAYGMYLTEKHRHNEAGVMYVKAEAWELALEAFQSCLCWRQIFCMAARLNYTTVQIIELAQKIALQLKDKNRFPESANVLEHYANDIEEAIVTLIEGCQWDEALRLMHRYKRLDFIETDLKSSLVENYEQQVETLESNEADFLRYRNRLGIVRKQKVKDRLELLDEETVNRPYSDLFSDTSSATMESVQSTHTLDSQRSTVYSKMSGRSSKNRRKAEHKRWKLKEGSPYEDFALIEALSKIVKYIDGLREDINSLLLTLVQFHYDQKASDLQNQYGKFLSLMEKSLPQIWQAESPESIQQPMFGPESTANSIAQSVRQGQSSQLLDKIDPVISISPVLRKDVRWRLHVLGAADG